MEVYRIGIIGCGDIARDHTRAYGKIDNVKVVAEAELAPDRREEFARDFSLQSSYEEEDHALRIISCSGNGCLPVGAE